MSYTPFFSGANYASQTDLGTRPKGTKKLLREYGAQLVCVRYRYDAERRLRFTPIELIVEQSSWSPLPARIADGTVVGVRVGVNEVALQRRIKQTGGKWNPVARVWEMP